MQLRKRGLHLLAAVDEALLHGWDTLLLLYAFLYARDLGAESALDLCCSLMFREGVLGRADLVVGLDVELDFFAREGPDSAGIVSCGHSVWNG